MIWYPPTWYWSALISSPHFHESNDMEFCNEPFDIESILKSSIRPNKKYLAEPIYISNSRNGAMRIPRMCLPFMPSGACKMLMNSIHMIIAVRSFPRSDYALSRCLSSSNGRVLWQFTCVSAVLFLNHQALYSFEMTIDLVSIDSRGRAFSDAFGFLKDTWGQTDLQIY